MSPGVTAEMPALSASALDDYDPFCAQCGTELEDDQEWCLECGAARTLIHRAPDWRVPVAIVATVVLCVLAGFAIALVNVSHRANAEAASTSAPSAAAAAAAPPPAPVAATSAAPAATRAPHLGSWPVGLSGWTVVLFIGHREATAHARAIRLARRGLGVGLLNTDQHPNLAPGNWVVFTGRYPHAIEASAAAARLRAAGHSAARARQVARPGGL